MPEAVWDHDQVGRLVPWSRQRMFTSPQPVDLHGGLAAASATVTSVLEDATILHDRAMLLAATDNHPYVQLNTASGEATGYRLGDTVVWIGQGAWGPVGCALGDGTKAVRVFAELASTGALDGVKRLNLPRIALGAVTPYLPAADPGDWDFRWTTTAPPPLLGEERVVPLGAEDEKAIIDLIEEAFPTTSTRPGQPRINQWYGIWDSGRLVACGADRSRGGVGFLAGLTVAPDRRGQGLGAALTAAMTRRLLAAHGRVTLGVMADNHHAARLYERLGFVGCLPRTSLVLGGS